MNLLITILIALTAIIALPFIIALFVAKDYTIQRTILINRSNQDVYDYIKLVKNHDAYNKWVMIDPDMKKSFTGTDGTVGFIYAWDSENKSAGKGEQEITALEEGRSVHIEIRFEKPFAGTGYAQQLLESTTTSQTKVTWSMRGKSVYPMNITNLFIQKLLGSDLEASLVNLKTNLEKN